MARLNELLNKNFTIPTSSSRDARYGRNSQQAGSLEDAFDFLKLVHNWEKVVGRKLAKHTTPLKNKRGVLVLLTDHSAISSQVSFMSDLIIQKVQEHYPALKGKIKKLSFIVDSAHFQRCRDQQQRQLKALGEKKLGVKKAAPKPTGKNHPYSPEYRKLKSQAQEKFANIKDPDVRELLISIYLQAKN